MPRSAFTRFWQADGDWHTNKEQYWRIKKSNNALWWRVTTNDGITYLFGGDDEHNAKASSEFAYDDYGNVVETREYADNATAPYRKTGKEFYPANVLPNGAHITNKVARVVVSDTNNARVSDTRYVYDSNAAYNLPPTVGELKQTLVTADGSNFFASATYGYDSYGNVTSVTDARNNTTTTTFDTQYHLL